MQLFTANNFTVVRQLQDPSTIGTTYYVQAVIRNAYTDAIIATLQLTDKGLQRFKKDWKVPADPSGEGFYVSIVTSVYSDSGYTTKSTDYGDEEETYLVVDRPYANRGGGIGARELREIVREELIKAKPEPIEFPEFPEFPTIPEMRFDEVLTAIKENKSEPCEKPDQIDLSPLMEAIQALSEKVPKIDFTPVLEALRAYCEDGKTDMQELRELIETTGEGVKKSVDSAIEIANLENQKAIITGKIEEHKKELEVQKEEEKAAEKKADINKLLSS